MATTQNFCFAENFDISKFCFVLIHSDLSQGFQAPSSMTVRQNLQYHQWLQASCCGGGNLDSEILLAGLTGTLSCLTLGAAGFPGSKNQAIWGASWPGRLGSPGVLTVRLFFRQAAEKLSELAGNQADTFWDQSVFHWKIRWKQHISMKCLAFNESVFSDGKTNLLSENFWPVENEPVFVI